MGGPAIDGGVLADYGTLSNRYGRLFASVLEILGRPADNASNANPAVRAESDVPLERGAWGDD
jgi:hypothetical protein